MHSAPMRGFQPAGAMARTHNFADGGIVGGIKKLFGIGANDNPDLVAYRAQRERERAAVKANRQPAASEPMPAEAPPAEGVGRLSEYNGMRGTEQRMKEAGLADGGRVRPRGFVAGPGTGTSDSIKARLSDGEYVLPADTVQAVGVDALDALKDATHTPVAKPDKNRAGEPLFANAGLVDDERKRNSFGDAAAAANDHGVQQVGLPTAAGGALNPPQKSAPSPVDILRTARGQAQDGSVAARSLDRQIAAHESAAATGKALGDAGRAVVGLFRKPDRGSDVSVFDAPPHPVVPNPTDQRLASGSQQAPGAPAVLPINATDRSGDANMPAMDTGARGLALPAANDQSKPQQVAPGIYRQGNSFGDSPEAASWGARGSKNPNANDLAAADALANRSAQEVSAMAARLQQPTAAGFQPMQAPQVEHSGNSWARRNELRNAQVSASSMTEQPGYGGIVTRRGVVGGQQGGGTASQQYAALLAQDMKARGLEPELAGKAMQENAGLQREGMREQGANAREAGRNALAQGELGLKREAAGFQTRAAAQQEQLRNVLLDPNATPEQRKIAQRSLAALSGKTAADRMQTVTLPDTTNEMGQVVRGGQALVRVLEDGTVQQVPIGAQAPAPIAAPKAGEVRNGYRFKGGNPNDQANWTKV